MQSGKVKSDVLRKPSVADEVNMKFRGKKGGKKISKLEDGEGANGSGRGDAPEDAAEESSVLPSQTSSLSLGKLTFS